MANKELQDLLIQLHQQYPNDMEFGAAVRELVWQKIQDNSPAY